MGTIQRVQSIRLYQAAGLAVTDLARRHFQILPGAPAATRCRIQTQRK